jgi:DNA polymerase III subunit gamma/tau
MTLLRMLAFVPAGAAAGIVPVRETATAAATPAHPMPPSRTTDATRSSRPQPLPPGPRLSEATARNGAVTVQPEVAPVVAAPPGAAMPATGNGLHTTHDWAALIERAELRGPVGQLAHHATLIAIEDKLVRLAIRPPHEHLADGPLVGTLEQRLGAALGRPVKVKFERDNGGTETPAEQRARADSQRRQAAEDAVRGDPIVQSLIETFGARVIPESVRPTDG